MRRRVVLAMLVLVACGMCALQFVDAGAGLLEQPLSAHGLGHYWWLWSATVILAGAAMLIEAAQWRSQRRSRIGPQLLSVAGAAFILVALFTTDPWYPWQHALTWTGWIHVIATGASMAGLSLAMLCSFERVERSDRSRAAAIARAFAIAFAVFITLTLGATLTLVLLGRNVPFIGLEERLLLTLALGWLLARR